MFVIQKYVTVSSFQINQEYSDPTLYATWIILNLHISVTRVVFLDP